MTDLQVRCFLEVAKCLSFTQASKKIFISQSNISRQIASLEAEWQLPLFDRNTKGVKLTPQGEILSEALSGIMSELQECLQRAKKITTDYKTSITIGCQEHIKTNSYLSQMLFGFREVYPDVKVVKERAVQSRLVEGLLNDYYDVIFVTDHDIKPLKGLDKKTLFYAKVALVYHKDKPMPKTENPTLADFKDADFIRYKPTAVHDKDDYMLEMCNAAGFEPHVVKEYEDFNQFLFAIEMGEGAAIILEEEEAMTNPDLRVISLGEEITQNYLPMQLVRKEYNNDTVLNNLFDYATKFSELHAIKDF